MELYLIRHGESDIPPGRLQKDYPLSELGRAQAAALGKRFRGMHIDHLVTTPYRRCLETAQPIADVSGVEHTELPGLGAIDVGPMSDIPLLELAEKFPDLVANPEQIDFSAHGAESPLAFHERVTTAFVDHIWERYWRERLTVICVSHQETVNAILCHIMGVHYTGFHPFKIDHTSVTKIDVRLKRPRIAFTNDISHLGELPVGASGKGRPAKE
jgi:broad specificity phosphatase PhoE